MTVFNASNDQIYFFLHIWFSVVISSSRRLPGTVSSPRPPGFLPLSRAS